MKQLLRLRLTKGSGRIRSLRSLEVLYESPKYYVNEIKADLKVPFLKAGFIPNNSVSKEPFKLYHLHYI